MSVCFSSCWQVQVHAILESEILSDFLARQHLHSSVSSCRESTLPFVDEFTGMCRWNGSKNQPLTWIIGSTPGLLLFSSMASFAPLLPPHPFCCSSPCPCLPCPIIGHQLWASGLYSACPLTSPTQVFQPKVFSFPSMAELDSRSCQVRWGSVGKGERRVSERAVHVYYFRLLAVVPKGPRGKSLERHTGSCVYLWWNKHVGV